MYYVGDVIEALQLVWLRFACLTFVANIPTLIEFIAARIMQIKSAFMIRKTLRSNTVFINRASQFINVQCATKTWINYAENVSII